MRVLNVIDGTGWCGTKEQTYLITKYLSEEGIESHIALSFQYEYMVRKLKDSPVKIHFFEDYKGGKSRFNPRNLFRLKRIVDDGSYNFVIAHSSHAFDYVRFVYPFLRKKPKIIALRRSNYFPNFLSRRFKFKIADKIVVTSCKVAKEFKERGFYPEKIVCISSGIELDRFYPRPELRDKVRAELGVKENEYMFINVANWQPWRKGQEVILKALKLLPFKNFKMFFVGLDTDSQEARELFKRYGLEENCSGLGFRSDIEKLLQGADLFIFGSYAETLAAAVVQAMACGKVVVSTDAGGIPEYLKDSVNGFLVKTGDYMSLANKIKEALSMDPARIEEIQARAVETARKYSIKNTVKKYVELLQELSA